MSARELLRANDERFLVFAGELSASEWAAPSLCDGWTNRDVLAHLVVGYSTRLGTVVSGMLRRRGSFDTTNADLARGLAATRSPEDLLTDFARLAAEPEGLGRYFPAALLLGDHVTHELDICYALDRTPTIAPDVLVAVLKTQVALPNPFVPAFGNSRGLQLVGTDVDWSHGRTGPVVRGRAAELVSVLGNRAKVADRLTGDGAPVLAERVTT
jgi:uncharacterized protein (TIGR03083 family)